jgi:hypothetical protein
VDLATDRVPVLLPAASDAEPAPGSWSH